MTEISRFGWFVVVWSGIVCALLTAALNSNVSHVTRILCLGAFLFVLIVGIERVRVVVARHRRDREQLKRSAMRFADDLLARIDNRKAVQAGSLEWGSSGEGGC